MHLLCIEYIIYTTVRVHGYVCAFCVCALCSKKVE